MNRKAFHKVHVRTVDAIFIIVMIVLSVGSVYDVVLGGTFTLKCKDELQNESTCIAHEGGLGVQSGQAYVTIECEGRDGSTMFWDCDDPTDTPTGNSWSCTNRSGVVKDKTSPAINEYIDLCVWLCPDCDVPSEKK